MKRFLSLFLGMFMVFSVTGCGGQANSYKPLDGLDTSEEITLRIAIPHETDKALNTISNAFMTKYPNVNIQFQYIEDYDTNALKLFKENALDIIFQKNITYAEYTETNATTGEKTPTGKTTDDYFYNFAEDTQIDFSNTNPDISNNYRGTRIDDAGNEITYQYSYPLGGETRGIFVNKTLLDQYGLAIPTNYEEMLACCETLKQNGLIAIQGGVASASYGLGLAPAANTVVHNEEALAAMRDAAPGVSREFEDILNKLYVISCNRYSDYKAVEQSGYFVNTSEVGQVESFLGLSHDPDTFEVIKPENNSGYVAFLPYLSSTQVLIHSLVEEYELDTEVVFIGSPLHDAGSSNPIYITPYYGFCANKNSANLIWIREFVNFFFQKDNNTTYSEEALIIPNTSDAMKYVADTYHVDVAKDVTLCGQIRFSDTYNGYTPIADELTEVLKCGAQKYMINLNKDVDGNIQYEKDAEGNEFLYMGNGETVVMKQYIGEEDPAMPGYAFCTLEYYLDSLETRFEKYRVD